MSIVDSMMIEDGRGEIDGVMVLYYPPGASLIGRVPTDNSAIAKQLVARLRPGAKVALPTGWRLEFIKGDPSQVEVKELKA